MTFCKTWGTCLSISISCLNQLLNCYGEDFMNRMQDAESLIETVPEKIYTRRILKNL